MKYYLLFAIILMSCSNEFTLRPEIKGIVTNAKGNPLDSAKALFIDCLNSSCNGEKPVFTDNMGVFTIEREKMNYLFFKPHKYTRPYYSYTLVISKKNFISDTIDIREYDDKDNLIDLSSIKLKEQTIIK